jgi:hypothetical protein
MSILKSINVYRRSIMRGLTKNIGASVNQNSNLPAREEIKRV